MDEVKRQKADISGRCGPVAMLMHTIKQFWELWALLSPKEAQHLFHPEALDPGMLYYLSLKHMVVIFTEHWGAERKGEEGGDMDISEWNKKGFRG